MYFKSTEGSSADPATYPPENRMRPLPKIVKLAPLVTPPLVIFRINSTPEGSGALLTIAREPYSSVYSNDVWNLPYRVVYLTAFIWYPSIVLLIRPSFLTLAVIGANSIESPKSTVALYIPRYTASLGWTLKLLLYAGYLYPRANANAARRLFNFSCNCMIV